MGLTWVTEDIDTIAFTPEGDLVISTIGPFAVRWIGGRDEDLIRFKATRLGQTTRGSWERYFDGSDIGLRRHSEDIRSAWIDPANSDIYLTHLPLATNCLPCFPSTIQDIAGVIR